jgi:hypothetical protein
MKEKLSQSINILSVSVCMPSPKMQLETYSPWGTITLFLPNIIMDEVL